jgi:chromate transporter
MLLTLFLNTLKIGALSFGGGYAIVSLLQYDLVTRLQLLSPAQFVDAIAVGQITPGPLLIMAAFMGYQVAGLPGAILALTALFLPCTVAVVVLASTYEKVQRLPAVEHAIRGVSTAVVGLLAAAVVGLVPQASTTLTSAGIAAAVFVLVTKTKIEPVVLVLASGVLGLLFLR